MLSLTVIELLIISKPEWGFNGVAAFVPTAEPAATNEQRAMLSNAFDFYIFYPLNSDFLLNNKYYIQSSNIIQYFKR